MGTALDVGDEGLWVTHVRGMKVKAMRELTEVCEEVSRAEALFHVLDHGHTPFPTPNTCFPFCLLLSFPPSLRPFIFYFLFLVRRQSFRNGLFGTR